MALVISGAKAIIKLSGEYLAFATGVSISHENNLEEIPQLDDIVVAEYAESGHRCTVTINTIKLASNASIEGQPISNSASSFGFDNPRDLKSILLQPEIIIQVIETVPVKDAKGNVVNFNDKAIYTAYGAKFAGGSGQVNAKGIWEGQWTFKARYGTGI